MNLYHEVIHNSQLAAGVPDKWKGNKLKFDPDRFAALCHQYRRDPAEEALKLLTKAGETGSMKDKELLECYLKLMEFCYPKLRASENTHNVSLSLADLLQDVEAQWHERKRAPAGLEG